MIPPLLLDIEPHHKCLDMCASPGNKTGQMLEALHKKDTNESFASGFVVANDADSKRAYMLHHQLKPYASPNLFITCQEAQYFPLIGSFDSASNTVLPKSKGLFDRILADVPCCGDGTLRKISGIWEKWDPNQSVSLHPLQVMIGIKGAHLLREGGLMVYSTCTINPIEDEAVVAQILRRCGGALELVDCSKKFPELITRPGLSSWKVGVQVTDRALEAAYQNGEKEVDYDKTDGARPWKQLRFYESYEEFKKHRSDHHVRKGNLRFPKTMAPSMWPGEKEEMAALNLHRCMRVLPHDQNTGGFFMCLFRKTKPIPPWSGSHTNLKSADLNQPVQPSATAAPASNAASASPSPKEDQKQARSQETRTMATGDLDTTTVPEEKVPDYLPVDKALWDDVKEHYGIQDEEDGGAFPPRSQLFYRPAAVKGEMDTTAKKHPKHISLVSKSLQENLMRPGIQQRLYVIGAGLHIFKRNDRREGCKYRVSSEGLRRTKGAIQKRIVNVTLPELAEFLSFSCYSSKDKQVKEAMHFSPGLPLSILSEQSRTAVQAGKAGSHVLKLTPEDQERYYASFQTELILAVWVGKHSISSLVSGKELNMIREQLKSCGLITNERSEEEITTHFKSIYQRKQDRSAAIAKASNSTES